MRRLALAFAVALLAIAWPGVSAIAADQSVEATPSNTFDPDTVTINMGDKVTWSSKTGTVNPHNVVADDDSFKGGGSGPNHDPAPGPWTFSHTFNQAGTFRYYCSQHGAPNGVGMSGKVVVINPNDTTPPDISSLKAKPSKFCTKKSKKCKKRGTRIRFTLSEDAHVKATVKRKKGGKRRRAFERDLKAGKNSVKFRGKGLKPGKYVLTLTATDASGNTSNPATTKFRVVKRK